MTTLFIIKLALLNSFSKKLRTSLTVSGIAISVAIIVLLLGIGSGLRNIVTTEIAKSDSQSAISVSSKRSKQLKLDQAAMARLKSISGVSQIEQMVGLSGRLTYHGISLDLPIYAVTPGYLAITPLEIRHGQAFTLQTQEDFPLLVSPVALQALGIKDAAQGINKQIGLQVNLTKEYASRLDQDTKAVTRPDYHVSAIIDKGTMPVAYMPLDHIEKQGLTSVAEVKLLVASPDKIASVREAVEQLGFQTSSIHDTIEQVNQIFSVIQTILVIFGAITLVIAIFGTLNTITITLVEQTRQVGFLRILGIRRQDVGRLFIIQAMLLSSSGVIVGVILGSLLGLMTNAIIFYIANRNGITGIAIYQWPAIPILLLVVSSVGLGWLLGLGPSRRAITMRPLEAIRA